MARAMPFTDSVPPNEVNAAAAQVRQIQESFHFQPPPAAVPDLTRFGFLFPELQKDPENLLPTSRATVAALKALGRTMTEPDPGPMPDSSIPSVYTYFGQFVDHDITLMLMPKIIDLLNDPNLLPLTPAEIDKIKNIRLPTLDLDSIYGEAPHVGDDMMLVGQVTTAGDAGPRPPGKVGNDFDLPRKPRSVDPAHDRAPRIGDPRNDENTIISQLHGGFLRAHNAIVAGGHRYHEARVLLRQHYQWIIVHDFLKRVADPSIVDDMLSDPRKVYNPTLSGFFMPLEFTVAAFRFGHSMIRSSYDFNVNFPPSRAFLLRLFNVLSRYPTLPEKWIIQWERFVEGGANNARPIETRLAAPLSVRLTLLDLLRGYVVRLPTGQAVARALGLHVMTDAEILGAAANQQQEAVLRDSGFAGRTPLWFYILAEAAHFRRGQCLGPVGSTLVASVLIGLIRRSKDSFLNIPGWTPTLRGVFDLPGLLRLAGVL